MANNILVAQQELIEMGMGGVKVWADAIHLVHHLCFEFGLKLV
jgi:hypothetical protein